MMEGGEEEFLGTCRFLLIFHTPWLAAQKMKYVDMVSYAACTSNHSDMM